MLRAIGLITVVAFVYYMVHDEAAYRPSAEARQTEQAKVRQNLGQINFPTLVAETGCTSTYSKERRADVFEQKYRDRWVTLTGTVSSVSSGRVMLKVMPTTLTSDVTVRLEDPSKAYYLEEGRRITVDFVLDSAGGCFLDYSGSHGTAR